MVYKIVLAPPGAGKTTLIQQNPHLDILDADDILKQISDGATNEPLCSGATMNYYINTPGYGFEKWHRVNFRAIVRAQHHQGLGTILTGFMVGEQFSEVQRGFDQFIGRGGELIESLRDEGVRKLLPHEIAVVLPDEEEYIRRGRGRTDRPVNESFARAGLRCYRELADRYPEIGRFQRLEDVPFSRK